MPVSPEAFSSTLSSHLTRFRLPGIFGVSTALWMYKRGGYSVTILDKAQILPAPDAASTDINKIIRSGDYADPTIAALNVDAVNEWRKPEWEGTYHEYV